LARFVARYARYSHGVREEIAEAFARGTRVIQKSLEAQFDPRGLTDFEKETAAQTLSFHGLPKDSETDSDVSPMSRLSLFDSEEAQKHYRWTDEEHDLVVDTLRTSDRNGLDFIEVSAPKRPAPWNGYDKLTDAKQIVELTLATETPVENVLAYERENEDREDVIAALEEIHEPSDDAVVIDASGA
jgi:hypothetical protein